MPQNTIYGTGGFDSTKPNGNAVEQWDDDTRTYTKFTAPTSTRAYTAAENAAADARVAEAAASTNGATLRQQADSALVTNRTFTALASPTTAQITAQVKAITRQNTGIIRLVLQKLDATD